MGQITIETKHIVYGLVILILAVLISSCIYTWEINTETAAYNQGYHEGVQSVPTPAPTPAATPTPFTQYTITYTVLQASTSGGLMLVESTAGQWLVLPDYNTWNTQFPQWTYSATVYNQDSSGRLYLESVNPVNQPYVYQGYPQYYYYGGNYWQYDGRTTDPIDYKEVRGHFIHNQKPPTFGNGAVYYDGTVTMRT